MPLLVRLTVLSSVALGLIGLLPSSASATATYTIGASFDLGALEIPTLDIIGQTSAPDANGVSRWWMPGVSESTPYTITLLGVGMGQITNWTAALKEDPFVTNNINITNNTGLTIVYVATVSVPIPAFAYNAVINSSVGITATDSDAFGDMLVDLDAGNPFYRGRVNGTTILPLTPPAVPITTADCPFPSPGCTATSSIGVASLAVAPDVATNIEIILRFVLSPGDSVGITSRFEIVPEPSTGVLLGLGLLGLALKRRQSR